MENIENWVVFSLGGVIIVRMLWDYIKGLKNPTNDEVRDVTRIEGRINAIESRQNRLEHLINTKVDNAVWLERSEKFEAFSKQHNVELREVKIELREIRKEIASLRN